ncbi:MAG TPA: transketolase C-terminal domain-containing protein, partial [Candidatus Polarisedimenticolia bacterium]|nr:transketolase C-terminal domain-containing protein [Candidatus Polarisedimenticolia bacterium]
NCRFVKPLDEGMLRQLASRYPVLITLEENTLRGGFGSGVAEFFAESETEVGALHHCGIPDRFVAHGSMPQLLEEIGLSPARLTDRVRRILRGRA